MNARIKTMITPKAHQEEAAAAAIDALATGARATVLMPCGTGKTLVGQMVTQALAPEATALLFPSIALIRQTLNVWRDTGLLTGASVLCVCSDKSIASLDDVLITEEDLGVRITTDALSVREFLKRPATRQVVFTTYHSVPVLSAGLPPGFAFDFALLSSFSLLKLAHFSENRAVPYS